MTGSVRAGASLREGLTMAIHTVAILTLAILREVLTMAILTMAILTMAVTSLREIVGEERASYDSGAW